MFHIAKMMHTKQYANILVCLLILLTKGKISGIAFDGKTSLFLLFLKKEITNRDFIGQSINHITYFENQTAAISAIRADTGCQPTYERCEFKIKLKKMWPGSSFTFRIGSIQENSKDRQHHARLSSALQRQIQRKRETAQRILSPVKRGGGLQIAVCMAASGLGSLLSMMLLIMAAKLPLKHTERSCLHCHV